MVRDERVEQLEEKTEEGGVREKLRERENAVEEEEEGGGVDDAVG
jgi:hypothetical protein